MDVQINNNWNNNSNNNFVVVGCHVETRELLFFCIVLYLGIYKAPQALVTSPYFHGPA